MSLWKPRVKIDPEALSQGMKSAGEAGAFPDLSEIDLVRLFNAARVVRLAPGEALFEAGDLADRLHVVTAGRIEATQTGGAWSEQFDPGDWLCDVDLNTPGRYETTALALTPSMVLVIDALTFANLDPELQVYLTRRVQRLTLERVRTLSRQNAQRSSLTTQLGEALFAARTRTGADFAKTPAAQQLLSKVPALPVSTTTLLNKMLDDRTTKAEIVELVSMDPALTSTLLKAANSPFYGFQYEITNVSHAIVLLGHNTVYQIIMSESMRRSLPNTPVFAEVHRRSIEISRLAFVLAQVLRVGKPAEAATIGILGDIGRVVTELLKTSNPRLSILFEQIDSAAMGAELLRTWKLPETLCSSLEYQHYPEFAHPERVPTEVRASVTILYLARRAYETLHHPERPQPTLFVEDYLAALGQETATEGELLQGRVLPRLRAQIRQLPNALANRLRV